MRTRYSLSFISNETLSDQSAGNYIKLPVNTTTKSVFFPIYNRTNPLLYRIKDRVINNMGTIRKIGSSETIREISSKYPNWFDDWFIGFSEGDGGFYCDRNAKRLYFKIRQTDYKILYKIKHYFNFGTISHDFDSYFTYTVSNKSHILTLIHLFNGRLVLEKTNKRFVSEWLDNYNHWYNASIIHKNAKPFVSFETAWLCGFTDADGSFGFKFQKDLKRKYGGRVRIYWYLDQTGGDLSLIKSLLKMGYIEKRVSKLSNKNSERLIVMNLTDCNQISRYFDNYKPQTLNKQTRFIRFKRVLNWCLDQTWAQNLDQIKHLICLNKRPKRLKCLIFRR